jgi:hypothetical protein
MDSLYAGKTIRTYTGLYVNVFEPKPSMFCIEDIAHALAHTPRFGGHLSEFYSVAQHCVIGTQMMLSMRDKYEFLMHDRTEAYLLDMPKPIKEMLPDYKALEAALEEYTAPLFSVQYPNSAEVKRVDKLMLEWEHTRLVLHEDYVAPIEPWHPNKAKERFLLMYNQLRPHAENK